MEVDLGVKGIWYKVPWSVFFTTMDGREYNFDGRILTVVKCTLQTVSGVGNAGRA